MDSWIVSLRFILFYSHRLPLIHHQTLFLPLLLHLVMNGLLGASGLRSCLYRFAQDCG